MTDLERLEANHVESEAAVQALMAQWKEEDAAIARDRAIAMERIENGRRDRDEMRVKLGGTSLIEADRQAAEDREKKRLDEEAVVKREHEDAVAKAVEEAARPRASSLPVTPIAALGQTKA